MAAESPAQISIGTKKVFQKGFEYVYSYQENLGVYICNKASEWSRAGEMLLLKKEEEYWIAYDAAMVGDALHCRQAVFRSDSDIRKPGLHIWQINFNVRKDAKGGVRPNWQDDSWPVETRHPQAPEPSAAQVNEAVQHIAEPFPPPWRARQSTRERRTQARRVSRSTRPRITQGTRSVADTAKFDSGVLVSKDLFSLVPAPPPYPPPAQLHIGVYVRRALRTPRTPSPSRW